MPQDTLMRALRLTPEDLNANRAGRLSDAQRRELRFGWRLQAGLWGATFLVMLAIMLGALFIVENGYVITVLLALPLILVGRVGRGLRPAIVMRRDELRDGTVSSVTGVITHTHTNMNYTLLIEGMPFYVPSRILQEMPPGGRYRVYYLPRSRYFLAAERV